MLLGLAFEFRDKLDFETENKISHKDNDRIFGCAGLSGSLTIVFNPSP